jgi:hypothetical protein
VSELPHAARSDLVRRAFRLESFTAGWMLIEAVVAIASGAAANSLSLIAFGADSLIELASAGVLLGGWMSRYVGALSFPRLSSSGGAG